MSEPNLKQRAHDAAIDHGMWLATDDDETNYQAFVAGYFRGWSDKGAYAPPRPKLEKVRSLLEEMQGWMLYVENEEKRVAALAELDAAEGRE